MSDNKSLENRVRRDAGRQGYLLRKSRTRDPWADDFGLYVLVTNSWGDRLPGAQGARSAFARGEGRTLADIASELATPGNGGH